MREHGCVNGYYGYPYRKKSSGYSMYMGPFLPRLSPLIRWPEEDMHIPVSSSIRKRLWEIHCDILNDEFGAPYEERVVRESELYDIFEGDNVLINAIRQKRRVLPPPREEIDLDEVDVSSPTPQTSESCGYAYDEFPLFGEENALDDKVISTTHTDLSDLEEMPALDCLQFPKEWDGFL